MIDRASENIEMLGSLSNEAKKQLEPLGHFSRSINILERTSVYKKDNN
jgi:hypothetical protein